METGKMSDQFGIKCPCEECILHSEICHTTCLHYKAFLHYHNHLAAKYRKQVLGDAEANARRKDAVVHWNKTNNWRKR